MNPVTIKVCQDSKHPHIDVLPCSTVYRGKANVQQYFQPLTTQEGVHLSSSLMGRSVKGVTVNTDSEPHSISYCQVSNREEHPIYTLHPVGSVTEWNKDVPLPAEDLRLTKMEEWIRIQGMLHD